MDKKMENKMKRIIKKEIEMAKRYYDTVGDDEVHYANVNQIDGMVRILNVLSGKDYSFNYNGLYEREKIK